MTLKSGWTHIDLPTAFRTNNFPLAMSGLTVSIEARGVRPAFSAPTVR